MKLLIGFGFLLAAVILGAMAWSGVQEYRKMKAFFRKGQR